MSTALLDRLMLTESRIEGMADGLRVLAGLDDPIGEVKSMKTRPNGLMIGKKTVPLGVVAIIYESRPNVTADAFGLCFKSANACILRGGSDSVNSNIAIVNVITDVLKGLGIDPDVISYISETDRKYVDELMHLNEYVDVIIPRGGAGLIKNVVNNSTVPVIETGTGNCHIYVDEYADIGGYSSITCLVLSTEPVSTTTISISYFFNDAKHLFNCSDSSFVIIHTDNFISFLLLLHYISITYPLIIQYIF